MDKILALLTDIKGFFTGIDASLAKLTAAEDRISALTADLATAQASVTAVAATNTTLTADLATAQAAVTAKGAEVTALTATVATEKARTNAVLAAQGLPLDHIPAVAIGETPGATSETPWAKWTRLGATDPRAAGAFWASNADAILKSRPKN